MTFTLYCFCLVSAIVVLVKCNKDCTVLKTADLGYNFTLPCSDNSTKDVVWFKQQKVPGKLFKNIEPFLNGSLLIFEALKNDSGDYLCKTLNSTEVVPVSVKKPGQNITIHCPTIGTDQNGIWYKQTKVPTEHPRVQVLRNGSLHVDNVTRHDQGEYICKKANVVESVILDRFRLNIKTPPLPLNVTVKASTIIALLYWNITDNGGYPILNFTAEFRLGVSDGNWTPISPNHIPPSARQLEIYSLAPNTTYEFRMWATNPLGRSPPVNVFCTTQSRYQEEDLLKHFFRGVEEFNASTFNISFESWTSIWSAAVGVFVITFVLLCFITVILLSQEWIRPSEDDPKSADVAPNIILNPNCDGNPPQQQLKLSKKAEYNANINHSELTRLNTSWATENATQK